MKMGRRDDSSHRPHQSYTKDRAFALLAGAHRPFFEPPLGGDSTRLTAGMPRAYRMMPAENATPNREIGVSLSSDRS